MVANILKKKVIKDLSSQDKTKKLFFDEQPNNFTRKEAVNLGATFNIAERTVGSFLKSCFVNYLQQPEYGHIQKSSKVEQKQKKEVKNYYFWELLYFYNYTFL